MEYFIICLTSLGISILTLFSGFALGTVLMPVFALFFPLPIAIASTAIVHLANNLFKVVLVGKFAEKEVVFKFGIPAALAAALGAYLLGFFTHLPPLYSYTISDHPFDVTYTGLAIGSLVMISSLFELIPQLANLSFNKKYLVFGGFLSGFFGGLSGHQGMLRSAFLIKADLKKEQFIGVSVVCAVIVDVVRVFIYGWSTYTEKFISLSQEMAGIIIAASVFAFLGAYIGSQLMHKATFKLIQILVGVMLLLLGACILIGLI